MSIKLQIVGLNNFLTTIYRQDMRLSALLTRLEFGPEQIECVRMQHLEQLVNLYIDLVRQWITTGRDGERLYSILSRRFSFDGQPVTIRQNLADEYGISRERVRQLEVKALKKCRSRKILCQWELTVQAFIMNLIGQSSVEIVAHQDNKGVSQDSQEPNDELNHTLLTYTESSSPHVGSATLRLDEIRQVYPHAYMPWTSTEDRELMRHYEAGATVEELVALFQRQPGGIRSRLTKLGLIK